MTSEAAWELLVKASKERELDDVKDAVQIYIKANPDTTYVQLEEAFRNQDVGVWLIAIEKPQLPATMTHMDLQGNLDKKYTVTYRFGPKPTRPRERAVWPETPEQNMERLADAGEVVDRGVSKCSNCNELGHSSKFCPQEKQETDTVKVVKCYNCEGEGHRMRDCIDRLSPLRCRVSSLTSCQAPNLVSTALPARTAARVAISARSAPSRALPRALSVASVARVCCDHPTADMPFVLTSLSGTLLQGLPHWRWWR